MSDPDAEMVLHEQLGDDSLGDAAYVRVYDDGDVLIGQESAAALDEQIVLEPHQQERLTEVLDR